MTELTTENAKNKTLELSKSSESYLKETSNWTYFFSILGFILVGLMVLGSILITIIFSVLENDKLPEMSGVVIGSIYFIIAIIYLVPIIYLYRFSTNMKHAIEKREEISLETAFRYFKSHFKYLGIVTIIFIALYIVLAVLIALTGVLSAFW